MTVSRTADDSKRRLRFFLIHLAAYFVATLALLETAMAVPAGGRYLIGLLAVWGMIVAFHAARVMGLIKGQG